MVKDWLPATVQHSAIECRLAAGQILFNQGDPAAGLYEVVRGKVRLTQVNFAGWEVMLGIACAGDPIGEASLFSPAYWCSATGMSKAAARAYPRAVLLAEFERNPKTAQAFMARLADRVMELRTRLGRRNFQSARDRVRHYLAAGAEKGTVVLPGTVKVAGELGLTHESLYRTLSEMKADGEIARLNAKITLVRSPYDRDHL